MPAPSQPLALSPKECQGYRWHPPQDLAFAQQHALIPLHVGELAKAATTMPLAVIQQGREWQLVGVCGTQTGHNLFIKQGKWLGHYRPQWLTTYPFSIMTAGDKGFVVLDKASDLLTPAGQANADAEPLFDEHGHMTPAVTQRVDALKANHGKQQATHKAITALADAQLLTPWPDTLKQPVGLAIDGLHMINEQALAQLDNDAFLALRQALPIAYAINLSLSQIHLLARLDRVNPAQTDAPENLDEWFGDDDDELSFEFD